MQAIRDNILQGLLWGQAPKLDSVIHGTNPEDFRSRLRKGRKDFPVAANTANILGGGLSGGGIGGAVAKGVAKTAGRQAIKQALAGGAVGSTQGGLEAQGEGFGPGGIVGAMLVGGVPFSEFFKKFAQSRRKWLPKEDLEVYDPVEDSRTIPGSEGNLRKLLTGLRTEGYPITAEMVDEYGLTDRQMKNMELGNAWGDPRHEVEGSYFVKPAGDEDSVQQGLLKQRMAAANKQELEAGRKAGTKKNVVRLYPDIPTEKMTPLQTKQNDRYSELARDFASQVSGAKRFSGDSFVPPTSSWHTPSGSRFPDGEYTSTYEIPVSHDPDLYYKVRDVTREVPQEKAPFGSLSDAFSYDAAERLEPAMRTYDPNTRKSRFTVHRMADNQSVAKNLGTNWVFHKDDIEWWDRSKRPLLREQFRQQWSAGGSRYVEEEMHGEIVTPQEFGKLMNDLTDYGLDSGSIRDYTAYMSYKDGVWLPDTLSENVWKANEIIDYTWNTKGGFRGSGPNKYVGEAKTPNLHKAQILHRLSNIAGILTYDDQGIPTLIQWNKKDMAFNKPKGYNIWLKRQENQGIHVRGPRKSKIAPKRNKSLQFPKEDSISYKAQQEKENPFTLKKSEDFQAWLKGKGPYPKDL